MDSDERDVICYLRSWPNQFVSTREISRRAGGKWRFRQDPNWANHVITRLVEKNLIESDMNGHYRVVRKEDEEARFKWIAPHLRKILLDSGKDFTHVIEVEDPEEFYGVSQRKSA